MKERIQNILDHEGLTSARFADNIGVQRSSVSHILSGRNKPGLDFLNKILIAFPAISGDWLITGQGEMLKGNQTSGNKFGSLFDQKSNNQKNEKEIATAPKQNISKLYQHKEENTSVDSTHSIKANEIPPVSNSIISNKRVERIIIFYTDNSFKEYLPE